MSIYMKSRNRKFYLKLLNMQKKTWFTLLETIIAISILWILSAILIQTYIKIEEITFRIKQEKTINQEVLLVSEVIQNLSDRNTINYSKYNLLKLKNNKWFTNVLFLTGNDWESSLYITWECYNKEIRWTKCRLELNKNWSNIKITTNKIILRNLKFKIIPFADEDSYYNDKNLCSNNYLICINKPWFFIFLSFFSKNYNNKQRTNNIKFNLQEFFNIN